jgi:hypothetical protein
MIAGNRLVARRPAKGGFYVFRQGEEDGPFPLDELEEMHRAGQLPASTPCRGGSEREWHDLAFILRAMEEAEEAPPPPRAVPSAAAVSSSGNGASAAAVIEPGPAQVSLRAVVADLAAATRRQNQLLAGVKWSLIALSLAVVALAAIQFWR